MLSLAIVSDLWHKSVFHDIALVAEFRWCLRPKPGYFQQLVHLHRLTKLEKPDQKKPVANQDSADVIIEEIVDEQQESGGSGFIECLSKIEKNPTWMFGML